MVHYGRLALVVGALTFAAACGNGLEGSSDAVPPGGSTVRQSVTVGSANFPENALLAEIYASALEAEGFDVSRRLNLGSREVVFPAMEAGEITVVPEYTGALLSYVTSGGASVGDSAGQVTELQARLPEEMVLLHPSEAQDQETITCTREVVEEYSLVSIGDLAAVSGDLTIGGPPELPSRQGFGLEGLRTVYGVEFGKFQPLDVSGPLTVSALKEGKIDCANLFSTSSAIEVNGFVSLEDPEGLIESEAVVPLVARRVASAELVEVLNEVSAVLTTDNLKEMVTRVEVDKADEAEVAGEFLQQHGLA